MQSSRGATLRTAEGTYRIHESVAVGGFASVYFGRNLKTNVPVAVKMLHPGHASNERVVRHFINEARLARGLSHPNVVRIIDQGQAEDGQQFIVMEWMTGWTIGQLIEQRGPLPVDESAYIIVQTLSALSAAHARSIFHRDIKPANLMLTNDHVVKVMDFGISKDASLASVGGSSGIMGTPAYMAPEQFRGERADARTDLYAIGVTLYQMLAGRMPFESDTSHGYMYKHLQQPAPPLRARRADLPPAIESIVLTALEKSRDRRFQSADAMAAAIRPFAGGTVTTPQRPPEWTDIGVEPGAPSTSSPPGTPPSVPPGPTRRPPHAAAVVPGGQVTSSPTTPPASPGSPPLPQAGASPGSQPLSLVPDGRGGWVRPPPPTPTTGTAQLAPSQRSRQLIFILMAVMALFGILLIAGALWMMRPTPPGSANATPTAQGPAETKAPPVGTAPVVGTKPITGPASSPTTVLTAGNTPSAASRCADGVATAAALRKGQNFAEAATTLESLRASACDVVDPLYDVYLDFGKALADSERTDEAIGRFDQALQIKNGSEAQSARALAIAYLEGRAAIEQRDWDGAIERLESVHRSSATYARGNVTGHLVNAYIGKGDDLRRQTKFDDAQTFYTRADQVRPNDQTIAARIRDTNDERTRNAAPPPPPTVPPPPTLRPAPVPTQPSPADIERVIRAYYGALTAGRYEEAYAVLSPQAQQAQPLSEFRRRLAPTSTFAVRSIEPPTIQGTTARARVHTQTTAAQGSSVGCSFIDWSLVLLDSTWRRNVISGSGNEGAESC